MYTGVTGAGMPTHMSPSPSQLNLSPEQMLVYQRSQEQLFHHNYTLQLQHQQQYPHLYPSTHTPYPHQNYDPHQPTSYSATLKMPTLPSSLLEVMQAHNHHSDTGAPYTGGLGTLGQSRSEAPPDTPPATSPSSDVTPPSSKSEHDEVEEKEEVGNYNSSDNNKNSDRQYVQATISSAVTIDDDESPRGPGTISHSLETERSNGGSGSGSDDSGGSGVGVGTVTPPMNTATKPVYTTGSATNRTHTKAAATVKTNKRKRAI